MKRPALEVADIIRSAGKGFIERNRPHLGWQQLKVLRAIEHCRTAALGGHLDQCSRCGHRAISFFSCRNHELLRVRLSPPSAGETRSAISALDSQLTGLINTAPFLRD